MSIQLSKKNKIIVIILLVLVLGGTGGYLLWRVNQDKTVAPTDSDASNCTSSCSPGATVRDAGIYNDPGVNCNEDEKGYEEGGHLKCCKPYTTTCVSVCGDGKCSSDETATSCAKDCACKDFTWTNKPGGTFAQSKFIKSITITNPNSTSTATTGIAIKFNGTTLAVCATNDTKACYKISKSTDGKQLITLDLLGNKTVLDAGAYTLSVGLPGPKDSCTEGSSFTVTPDSVCGNGICESGESTSCATDCVCKALVWSNKPHGTYTPTTVPNPVTITNPNSTSSATTGTAVTLNGIAIPSCSSTTGDTTSTSVGAKCYTVSTSAGQQTLTISLLGDNSSTPKMDIGNYTLSVSLPGQEATPCKEVATFSVGDTTVPETGIFDGVMTKIYLGTGFVFLGIMTTQLSKFGYMFNVIGERNRVVLEERKRKREEDKRNRFERRFK